MKTFGTIAAVSLGLVAAFSLLMFGASVAGFWGGTLMVVAAVISLVMWGTCAGLSIYALTLAWRVAGGDGGRLDASLAWTRNLLLTLPILSTISIFLLALGAFASCGPLWLSALYHWGGVAGSLFGWIAFFGMPYVVRACVGARGDSAKPASWGWPFGIGLGTYGLLGIVWLVLWLVLRGSIDVGAYPTGSTDYKLPFPAGESSWIIQGNNSGHNHNGSQEHAWDFRRRCGSPVLAARGGTVTNVVDTNDGRGADAKNNRIVVTHGDGSNASYLHIEQDSATVATGDPVDQGDQLANVGNVGKSLTGHIHFAVRNAGGNSMPVVFADVSDDDGIPRTFNSYTSKNR